MDNKELLNQLAQVMLITESHANPISAELAERAVRIISRQLHPFTLPPHVKSKSLQNSLLKSKQVHIGCGTNLLEDFINVDMQVPADILWDVRCSLPFESESLELVFSEHMLEHFDYDYSAKIFLAECFRSISKGGRLIIGVPDAESAVLSYAINDTEIFRNFRNCYLHRNLTETYRSDFDILGLLFLDEYSHERYNSHHWAYSEDSLKQLIMSAGFSDIIRLVVAPEFSNQKRRTTTIYVEARKSA
jgi:predicted SAM-dependent methyltransferase